jgi:hypothetical protein
MSDRNLEALNERERTCLTYLRQAQELGGEYFAVLPRAGSEVPAAGVGRAGIITPLVHVSLPWPVPMHSPIAAGM